MSGWDEGVPLDLKVILVWLLITPICIFAPFLSESILRPIVAIPMVLLIPGYMLVAILFPEKTDISVIERIALSVGLSIALVPLIGLALNYTVFGIRLVPVVLLLEIITLTLWIIAYQRKIATGLVDDITIPNIRNISTMLNKMSRTERILSYVLFGCIVMALGTTMYVAAVPRVTDQFTEFYFVSPNGNPISNSLIVSADIPSSVIVGIRNQEFRTIEYTVEAYLTKTDMSDMRIIGSFPIRLEQGGVWEGPVNFTVPDASYGRVDMLLFVDGVPRSDIIGVNRITASYRNLHWWITVNETSNGYL